MKVLSCFDGISCGQLALHRAGIVPELYMASEIDKPAIACTMHNFPNTIQLGDVVGVREMAEAGIIGAGDVDLLIGGSPCQGFSSSGKGLNFSDPRSHLFFEFVRIKNALQPRWFLLENVNMKREWIDVINDFMGVAPVMINSADFSAQNRPRLYWTNIPIAAWVPRYAPFWMIQEYDDAEIPTYTHIRYSFAMHKRISVWAGNYIKDVTGIEGKSRCLITSPNGSGNIIQREEWYRYPTVRECERLQTLPDGYTDTMAPKEAYKAIGNGWTVDVIAHIFGGMHRP